MPVGAFTNIYLDDGIGIKNNIYRNNLFYNHGSGAITIIHGDESHLQQYGMEKSAWN